MNKYHILTILLTSAINLSANANGGHDQHEHPADPNATQMKHGDMDMPEHQMAHDHMSHAGPTVGTPVKPQFAQQKVKVSMDDSMRYYFEPDLSQINSGAIIQFEATNKGKLPHEFSIGTAEEQQRHAVMMKKMPNMKHNDGSTLSLEPGETKSLTWQFHGEGSVVFACNMPGHFEAGMFKKADLKN